MQLRSPVLRGDAEGRTRRQGIPGEAVSQYAIRRHGSARRIRPDRPYRARRLHGGLQGAANAPAIAPFFNEHGSEKTIALLRRFRKQFATHPIYTENFEFYLVIDLLDQNRIKDALAFRDEFRESGLDCNKALLAIGKGYQKIGLARPAAIFYKRLLLLDPSNREAAGKLKEVEEGSKK